MAKTKEETAAYNKAYYKKHKERLNEKMRARHHANRDDANSKRSINRLANLERESDTKRRWYEDNKERAAAAMKSWKMGNRGKVKALHAKRRAAKLQRTPVWADHLVIRMIYEDCPAGHQVDHIYPLQGDTVSGLHVPWNLQYLTPSENASKGNRYAP